jgi:hypothetical protein
MAQAVKYMVFKCEALSSNLPSRRRKKEERRRRRKKEEEEDDDYFQFELGKREGKPL